MNKECAPAPAAGPRSMLVSQKNPEARRDYLIRFSHEIGSVQIQIGYVPDRLVLGGDCMPGYLEGLVAIPDLTPEALGRTLLDDLLNELVPRYVRVLLRVTGPQSFIHEVRLDERQPKWDNDRLISQLGR